MQVLRSNVLILKQKPEYQGLIQGVASDENTQAKVMGIGDEVQYVSLGNIVILDWNKAKNIKNELWVVDEENIVAILDDEEII
jgi:hypothetical protein